MTGKLSAASLALVYSTCCLKAAVLTVTSLADSGSGSLRGQVAASSAGDTIQFAVNGTIVLSSAVSVSHTLTIQGPGPSALVVDANHADRAFITSGATTTIIIGMTITNGLVVGAPGANGGIGQNGVDGSAAVGGAIFDQGNALMLSNCWLVANTVEGGQGGQGGANVIGGTYFNPGNGGAGGDAIGGAVYTTSAQVSFFNCTFSSNSAVGGVGGQGGTNIASSLNYGGTGGEGGDGQAGAVQSVTALMAYFTNCTFSGNLASGSQGGAGGNNTDGGAGGTGGFGGNGTAGAVASDWRCNLESCTIVSNQAIAGLGGLGGNGIPSGASGSLGAGQAGGVYAYGFSCINPVQNTILADNFATSVNPNFMMGIMDNGHNFIGSDDCGCCPWSGNSQVGTVPPIHPQLGPLAQNGGGLPTHATTLTSPVTDQGYSALATDERGAPRVYDWLSIPNNLTPPPPLGNGADIGAFELGSADVSLAVISNNVVVSWPAYYGDFQLQSASNLQASNGWSMVSNSPAVMGSLFVVTNQAHNIVQFYRLVNPAATP